MFVKDAEIVLEIHFTLTQNVNKIIKAQTPNNWVIGWDYLIFGTLPDIENRVSDQGWFLMPFYGHFFHDLPIDGGSSPQIPKSNSSFI